jgi:hypothetical protein
MYRGAHGAIWGLAIESPRAQTTQFGDWLRNSDERNQGNGCLPIRNFVACPRIAFRIALLLLLTLSPCLAAPPAASPPPIDDAFTRMYNTDFAGAHADLDRYVTAQPSDPFGYAVQASAYLFSELDRLGILESEFFADDKRIIEKKKLKPDPVVRDKFMQAVDDAQSRGAKILQSNSNDQNALFSMAITQGVIMDYTALVEKRQLSSLSSARRANSYAQQLLKANPQFYDAYLTTGLSEYLLGSLPFFVKWFVHFDGVNGDKGTGIDNLKLVARSGHYLRPFAKILLAVCYLREKQPRETQKLLAELSTEFPANPLLRKELAKVSDDLAHGAGAGAK